MDGAVAFLSCLYGSEHKILGQAEVPGFLSCLYGSEHYSWARAYLLGFS